ncbi:cell division protein FtsL [Clostridium omnivorum]|uniref:Cell division protein FtsL n=1 Tax=Clostridium omnivorum TaxID=1604902 RepID=A0ABQ5NB12_9CLOT|nr:cell division protein FtsL [Clostridium sp. E14]
MVMKDDKNRYINGNTVLVPDYTPERKKDKEEYEKLKKAREERLNQKKAKSLKDKKNTLICIVASFAVCLLLISRYTTMYSMEKELSKVKVEINTVNVENESLNLALLKESNLQHIEEVATNKLHMMKVDKNNVIYADLSKDNFGKTANEEKKTAQENIIEKIKNILF